MGNKWKPVTAYDVATRRWFDVWMKSDPNPDMEPKEEIRNLLKARLECFNMTKYPPFKAANRDVQ